METIEGTLSELGGRVYDIVYDLVFTSERVIAVNIKNPLDLQSSQSLNFGSLIFGNWGEKLKGQREQDKLARERREAITRLTPDELLKTNPFNLEIKYAEISSAEIKRGLFGTKLKFVIERAGQTKNQIIFTIKKHQIPETKLLLQKVLKSKFHE